MNEWNTLLDKNIYLLFLKGAPSSLLVWEIDGVTYTQRGDFFLSYIFFWEPGGVNTCNPLQAVSSETLLLGCVSLAWLLMLCTRSKSDHVVITWSPSGYTPVEPDHPDGLSSLCLLITTWHFQSTEGHLERTENPCHILYNTVTEKWWL